MYVASSHILLILYSNTTELRHVLVKTYMLHKDVYKYINNLLQTLRFFQLCLLMLSTKLENKSMYMRYNIWYY